MIFIINTSKTTREQMDQTLKILEEAISEVEALLLSSTSVI